MREIRDITVRSPFQSPDSRCVPCIMLNRRHRISSKINVNARGLMAFTSKLAAISNPDNASHTRRPLPKNA